MRTFILVIGFGTALLNSIRAAESAGTGAGPGAAGGGEEPGKYHLANGLNLVALEDPTTYAIEFKNSFKSAAQEDEYKPDTSSAVLNVDSLVGYRYHPKLHANGDFGYSFKMVYLTGVAPPIPGAPATTPQSEGVGTPNFLNFQLTGGYESAPVKPATSDSLDWKSSNAKASAKLEGRVPYSDWLGDKLGQALGSRTLVEALILKADASNLWTRPAAPNPKDGFRGTLAAEYGLPFLFDSEIYATYVYTFGPAMTDDHAFYSIELSRYVKQAGTYYSMFSGRKAVPRLFVRYYEGGVAPNYVHSHGFEFGIGTTVLK